MADVVFVVFVEFVVCFLLEGGAPEDEAVVEGEPDAFEEERVLQAAEVLQVVVLTQREVEVAHAEGEMLG